MSLVIALYVTVRVAPLAGAWIEIEQKEAMKTVMESLPSRERGLKYNL